MTIRTAEFANFRQFLIDNRHSTAEQANVLERLSTLKKVNRPSDDPSDYRQIQDTHAELMEAQSFQDNIQSMMDRNRITEDILDDIRGSMDEVRELAIQGTSFIYDDLERETIADEMEQLRLNIINRLNTQLEGDYIFSGTLNDTEPFQDPVTGAYSGNLEVVDVRVSKTDTVRANFTGEEIAFGATGQGGAEDILDIIDDLVTAFRNNDLTAVNAEIPRLRPAGERLNALVSEVGNRSLRLVNEQNHYDVFEENLRSVLADLEDADLAEETVNLETVNTTISAQLRSQGSINRQSLLDFLG